MFLGRASCQPSSHQRIKTGISLTLISYHLTLIQGPQLPSLSPKGKCWVWARSRALRQGLQALGTSPPRTPLLTRKTYVPSLLVLPPAPPPPRKGFGGRRAAFNPSSTTHSPGGLGMGYLTSPNRRSSSNTDSGRNAAGLQGRMLTDEMKSVTDSAWRVELGQYPQIHPSPCP